MPCVLADAAVVAHARGAAVDEDVLARAVDDRGGGAESRAHLHCCRGSGGCAPLVTRRGAEEIVGAVRIVEEQPLPRGRAIVPLWNVAVPGVASQDGHRRGVDRSGMILPL